MSECSAWIVKNEWGSLLRWTFASTRRGVINTINEHDPQRWGEFKKHGCKIVKIRITENDCKQYIISPKREKELVGKYWKILKKYQTGEHPGQLTNIMKQMLKDLEGK